MRRAFLVLAALSLVFAACGDDDSSVFTTTTQAPPTSSTTTTTTSASTTTAETSTTIQVPPTTAATTTTTQPPEPVTVHPGLPDATSRSLIPWDEVDAGWVVARYEATTTDFAVRGPVVIYLVDPGGARYEIRAFDPSGPLVGEVEGFSNDGRRVAMQLLDPVTFEATVVSLDLETGLYRTVLDLPNAYASLGTTLPTGRDVVVLRQDLVSGTDNLEVYRTNGALFAAIASQPSGWPGYTWLYGFDGTFLVVGDGSSLAVYENTGALVRTLATPPGSCEPIKWWTAGTILAACVPQDVLAANGYYHVLWLIPLDGSAGVAITAPPPPNWDVVEFGHANAWVTGGQTLLQWYGDCAARGIQVLGPGTNVTWLTVEPAGSHWIHAQDRENLIIHSIAGCGDFFGPVSLIGPDGSLVRTLVPQIAGYIGVTSVAAMIPVP